MSPWQSAAAESAPAASVDSLLLRDWELEWLGANVNFLGGLLIVAVMIGVKAFLLLAGSLLSYASALIVASIFAASVVVVNDAIAAGGGGADSPVLFGDSFWSLIARYFDLKVRKLLGARGAFAWLSIASGTAGAALVLVGVAREALGL